MGSRVSEYESSLARCSPAFLSAAQQAYNNALQANPDKNNTIICRTSAYVAGPVLFLFVWQVLRRAQTCGLRRLYFLARDGWILRELAEMLCIHFSLEIECRYLYCSRLSLRRASYLLPEVDAARFLFEGGYSVTPRVVFARAGMGEDQVRKILARLKKEPDYLDLTLSKWDMHKLQKALKDIPEFYYYLRENAERSFENCAGYLAQEGLVGDEPFGIVDTGWTGSMQSTLCRLLRACGCEPQVQGYYFGLLNTPSPGTGGYHPWYLTPHSPPSLVGRFNNNLIECFCASPDHMTVSYRQEDGRYLPLFSSSGPPAEAWNIALQQQVILSFARELLPELREQDFSTKAFHLLTRRLLERFLFRPTDEEARVYGAFPFCDDMTEYRLTHLAAPLTQEELADLHLWRRICATFLPREGRGGGERPIFWPGGALALSDIRWGGSYRARIYLWEVLHHIKRNLPGKGGA